MQSYACNFPIDQGLNEPCEILCVWRVSAANAEVSLGATQCCSSVEYKGLKPNKPFDLMSLCSYSDVI